MKFELSREAGETLNSFHPNQKKMLLLLSRSEDSLGSTDKSIESSHASRMLRSKMLFSVQDKINCSSQAGRVDT